MTSFEISKIKQVLAIENLELKDKFSSLEITLGEFIFNYLTKENKIVTSDTNCTKIYDIESRKKEFEANMESSLLINDSILCYISNDTFHSFDLINQKEICKDTSHNFYTFLALKDGLCGSSSDDGTIKIYDPLKGCIQTLGQDSSISFYAMCQLEDGTIVGAGNETGIRFYDPKSGNLLKTIPKSDHKHESEIFFLDSPYPDVLISCTADETKIWDMKSWECIKILKFGCSVMQIKVWKDCLIFQDKIYNYKKDIEYELYVSLFDGKNLIVQDFETETEYWYKL